MSRRLRPSFEPLETKGLLSHMVTGLVQHHAGGGVAAEMGSPLLSLKVRLTTDHPSYRPGQIVKLTFTEMNHTGHDVFVELGPSIDGFSVTKAGKTIWTSRTGFLSDDIFLKKLSPGASVTLNAAWSASAVTGKYVAHNQLDPHGASAAFRIVMSPVIAAHAAGDE